MYIRQAQLRQIGSVSGGYCTMIHNPSFVRLAYAVSLIKPFFVMKWNSSTDVRHMLVYELGVHEDD